MHVNYMPSLMDQIRGHRDVAENPVVVRRFDGKFIERVDPLTRQSTGEPQQFLKSANGVLAILPRYRWVAEPTVIETQTVSYR